MKILVALLFCSLILGCFSSVSQKHQREIPGHEGQCYDKEENKFYKKGEEMKWTGKTCGRKLCGNFNGKIYNEIQTCVKTGKQLPPGCHFKANLDLPYPDCCERVVCPDQNRMSPTSNEAFAVLNSV